ncbi:TadE/TadG family type IV pilus assembly protein [Leisingera sp. McT4-56]|uniref:TadE/TadG family type IV pilus assembly protein n=1 Tax=Leisingera sp. McT4-56 TaxID=2881255 RepID=UPI001CF8A7D2|nr:pilus assembly protein [Leisingera sp. McT4-56]MCB4455790.1 pilus assembly protein [Leisingera sp. McT4-56]
MLYLLFRFQSQHLPGSVRSFAKETRGSVTLEFALYAPLLVTSFLTIYTLFDGFRRDSVNLKAAYTVSDLISRETTAINDDYLDSMYEMAKLLIRQDSQLGLRVSVVHWDDADDKYYVDWSEVRGTSNTTWTDVTINTVSEKLPDMPDQERVILVETFNEMEPAFDIGLPTFNIDNFVFTRPRFAPLVAFEGSATGGGSHDDGGDGTD